MRSLIVTMFVITLIGSVSAQTPAVAPGQSAAPTPTPTGVPATNMDPSKAQPAPTSVTKTTLVVKLKEIMNQRLCGKMNRVRVCYSLDEAECKKALDTLSNICANSEEMKKQPETIHFAKREDLHPISQNFMYCFDQQLRLTYRSRLLSLPQCQEFRAKAPAPGTAAWKKRVQ